MAKRSRTKNQPAPTVVSVEPMVLEEATGTDQPHLQQRLITQVCETLWAPEGLGEDEQLARFPDQVDMESGPTWPAGVRADSPWKATHESASCYHHRQIGRPI